MNPVDASAELDICFVLQNSDDSLVKLSTPPKKPSSCSVSGLVDSPLVSPVFSIAVDTHNEHMSSGCFAATVA